MSNPRMVVATSRVRKPHSTNVCITPAYRSRSNWFSFESTVFVAATVRAGRFVSRSRGSSLPRAYAANRAYTPYRNTRIATTASQ